MVVGVVEAAALAGCSRQTIWRKLKAGTLSAAIGSDGGHRIDTAELLRVFGRLQPAQPSPDVTPQPSAQPAALSEVTALLRQRIADLERDLDAVRRELDAERNNGSRFYNLGKRLANGRDDFFRIRGNRMVYDAAQRKQLDRS